MDVRPPESELVYEPFMSGFAMPNTAAPDQFPRHQFWLAGQRAAQPATCCRASGHRARDAAQGRLGPPTKTTGPPTSEEQKLLCPEPATVAVEVKLQIDRCDKAFRTSKDPSPNLPIERPMVGTDFFEDAPLLPPAATDKSDVGGDVFEDPNFEIDFASFAEAICGKEVPENAYGKPGGIVKLSWTASASFAGQQVHA